MLQLKQQQQEKGGDTLIPGANMLEEKPLSQTPGWASGLPTWSQQAESLASAQLGLHRIKSCYPFISLEITVLFTHTKLAQKM